MVVGESMFRVIPSPNIGYSQYIVIYDNGGVYLIFGGGSGGV